VTIRLDDIRGIDVHVHITTGDRETASEGSERSAAALAYFKVEKMHATGDEIADISTARSTSPR
jgi:hypothetical protein